MSIQRFCGERAKFKWVRLIEHNSDDLMGKVRLLKQLLKWHTLIQGRASLLWLVRLFTEIWLL